jgi:hypothetical protein
MRHTFTFVPPKSDQPAMSIESFNSEPGDPRTGGNRHQRRAMAKLGRLEARRVAKAHVQALIREQENRKAKQDAENSVVPVPVLDPDAEG